MHLMIVILHQYQQSIKIASLFQLLDQSEALGQNILGDCGCVMCDCSYAWLST